MTFLKDISTATTLSVIQKVSRSRAPNVDLSAITRSIYGIMEVCTASWSSHAISDHHTIQVEQSNIMEAKSSVASSNPIGNQQSDLGEQEAWEVIGHIPVVNFFYGGIRAAVYASKYNSVEA